MWMLLYLIGAALLAGAGLMAGSIVEGGSGYALMPALLAFGIGMILMNKAFKVFIFAI